MNAYLLTQLGFVAVTIVFYGILLKVLKSALRTSDFPEPQKKKIFTRLVTGILLWAIITAGLSLSGVLSDFSLMPPKFAIVPLVPLIIVIWIVSTKATGEILQYIPETALIHLQVFRVIVEILLWALFTQNLLPVQMTFEGKNVDIVAGLTAPLVAWLYQNNKISKGFVVAWNFICLGFLINIVTIAILSLPTPFRVFLNDPSSAIVTTFPMVWLPGLLVPLAYTLHLLSLRQLLQRP